MSNELSDFLTRIQLGKFDSLLYWLSKEEEIQENYFAIDFYGSEYTMVKYLTNIGLSSMKYKYLELGNLNVLEEKLEKKIQLVHQNKLQYSDSLGTHFYLVVILH